MISLVNVLPRGKGCFEVRDEVALGAVQALLRKRNGSVCQYCCGEGVGVPWASRFSVVTDELRSERGRMRRKSHLDAPRTGFDAVNQNRGNRRLPMKIHRGDGLQWAVRMPGFGENLRITLQIADVHASRICGANFFLKAHSCVSPCLFALAFGFGAWVSGFWLLNRASVRRTEAARAGGAANRGLNGLENSCGEASLAQSSGRLKCINVRPSVDVCGADSGFLRNLLAVWRGKT